MNPQNPYESYIVKASAGSGKTYQLSRRFLFLVAAGSHPSQILTVTFTRKAAKEMKERILELASDLLNKPKWCQEFEESNLNFQISFKLWNERTMKKLDY